MKCNDVRELISQYIENNVDTRTHEMMSSHFQECDECRVFKETFLEIIDQMSDLEEDVPFFLRNRLLNLPERMEKRKRQWFLFPKWAAAAVGTFILFFNLFYFTNIYPAANRGMHSFVADMGKIIDHTAGFVEKLKESKNILLFTFFNKRPLEAQENTNHEASVSEDSLHLQGEKNG